MSAVAEGTVVAGRYRAERLLHEGAHSAVFAATYLRLGRPVALKVARPPLSAVTQRRFELGARALATIQHLHVVGILDYGLSGGTPYIVTELLEGEDLAKVLARDRWLPVHLAARYVLQTLDALGAAHARGFVHRDIRPGHLFVVPGADGGDIKVLDFGGSREVSGGPVDPRRSVLASPDYTAPEIVGDLPDDLRADLWSVGVVLYELVAGARPFRGNSAVDVMVQVITGVVPPLRGLRPDAPPGLEAVIERCLRKDRAQRFQSAAELTQALSGLGL
jgi:eukaryotic-like serine/threonine-protein kinase